MVQKCLLILVIIHSSLFAALGSGPFIRTGIGICGLYGTELYVIPTEVHYREISQDSLLIYYDYFASSQILVRPIAVIGWEQSFNRVLSLSSGLGLAFSGAKWKSTPIKNANTGKTIQTPEIDARLDMTYLTVPIDAKLMLPLNSGGFMVTFGPQMGILCGARYENRALSKELDERSLFRPVSIGLDGSFGGEIQLRKLDLIIALRIFSSVNNESLDKSFNLGNLNISLETGLRWTTKRHKKSSKWPL
jgi:hypothetical protein